MKKPKVRKPETDQNSNIKIILLMRKYCQKVQFSKRKEKLFGCLVLTI